MLIKLLYKSYVTSYRIAAGLMLYGLLVAIAGYGFTMGFYAINSSWMTPFRISPSNDRILTMTSQLVSSQSALNTLALNNSNLDLTKTELLKRRAALLVLNGKLDDALVQDRAADTQSGTTLASLAEQKRADLAKTQKVTQDVDKLRAGIEHDLKAGLITKAEALAQETALTQFQNQYTDSKVSEVVLRDTVRQKLSNNDLTAVDTLSKQVDLKTQIAQVDLQIATGDEQIVNNKMQIDAVRKAVDATSGNPYFLAVAAKESLMFAFVPYDNADGVTEGGAVYDCYLSMVACRKVGTVKRVFQDEETANNPIYKTQMRGFLVQLDLTNHNSAKSKTLFVGHKPLWF